MLSVALASLLSAFNYIKPKALALISLAPFPVGMAVGYAFKPEIKLVIDLASDLIKVASKLI